MGFCRWLSAVLPWARDARLPTEEEWEYGCRAGSETRYWSGDGEADLDRVGWYDKNSEDRTHRVGESPANPWCLYDVHGNVWEWTLSAWTGDYSGREAGVKVDPAAIDPADLAAPPGGRRVIRGGSCWDEALRARSAYRFWWYPGYEDRLQGFRVLLPAAPRP
ncbi:MAG: formylglycine-generating enzyme family protein, partial [bacterium]|nr:formylglycine-generating enzyme family protein [bacterium]